MTCAALLAALFPGFALADVDRGRVYEVPATFVAGLTLTQRTMAKGCAWRHGIRWKVVGK